MPNLIKLAGKFKSELRQQYKDSMSYPDAGEIARRRNMGEKSPREKVNEAFSYIEKSKNPTQAKNRAEEMFGDFDVDGAIEEAGGFDKAFKTIKPVNKSGGGIAKGARAGKKVVEAIERRAKAANRKKDKAKEDEKKDKRKAMALAGATGATLAGGFMLGAEKEKERLEKKYDNKVDIKNAREAAKKKGNKTFTVDGLRYDTATGRRKPLSAAPLLEATQRRINFEKTRNKKEKNKKPVKKKTGGLVTRWESKWG